jgi:ATP-dependent protease HslVU (ClpYQ) peptidase subunit
VTTIAWRGRILAADTQLTLGDDIKTYCRKLYQIKGHGCMACAGDTDGEWLFRQWFMAGEKLADFEWKRTKKFEALHVNQWKDVYWYDDGPTPVPVEHEFAAIGTGSKFAMAAMHLGATAKEAVLFASELDQNTNALIDTYDSQTDKVTLCQFPKLDRSRWAAMKQ